MLRSNNDTSGLGYTSTKEGDSSKSAEERNNKGKNYKPTCHDCGKKEHNADVCRRKTTNQNVKPKIMTHCHKCNKECH